MKNEYVNKKQKQSFLYFTLNQNFALTLMFSVIYLGFPQKEKIRNVVVDK